MIHIFLKKKYNIHSLHPQLTFFQHIFIDYLLGTRHYIATALEK